MKLIRKAQIATTTNKDILVAEHVRDVLAQFGIAESVEDSSPSTEITPSDYNHWMGVVHDVAKQSGITITKKSQLADIAMDILDNDPKIDSQAGDKESVKSQIINNMWDAHKATVGHARLQNTVKKAREEEESGFAQDFKSAQGVEDEQTASPMLKSAVGDGKKNPYMKGSLRYDLWNRMHSSVEDEESDLPPPPADDVPHDEMSDDMSDEDQGGDNDMSAEKDIHGADEVGDMGEDDLEDDMEDDQDPEDLLASLSTDELEAELARRQGEDEDSDSDLDSEDPLDGAPGSDSELPPDDEPVNKRTPADASSDELDGEDDDVSSLAKKITAEDEEAGTQNFFRRVVTAPVEDFRAAVADVEKEGEGAWHGIKLPKNPHPKKSHAHKAWQKGFTRIAKAALGIQDPKPMSTSKQKKKR